MIKISFIGFGNVAQHLIHAFNESREVKIVQIFARNKPAHSFSPEIEFISDWEKLIPVDVFIISVSDDAIAEVSKKIALINQLVVHTSGTVSLEKMSNHNRRGVFYPLQTFTKGKKVDFSQIPLCIETEFSADLAILKKLAHSLSEKTFIINSEQRKALHVAAVFVNNFVNHMYQLGNEICQENQIPFNILEALINETASKIKTLTPQQAQTGPAKRNDKQTIDAHLNFLEDDFTKQSIYKLLTQSIQDNEQKL